MRISLFALERNRMISGVLRSTYLLVGITLGVASFAQSSLFDGSFGVGTDADGLVTSVVVQPDGKIVIGGGFDEFNGQSQSRLARLNPNGGLDIDFPGGTDGTVYALLAQPDGRIVAGGSFSTLQGEPRGLLGRILTNGLPDTSFDPGDFLVGRPMVLSLALQLDGKVLVGTQADLPDVTGEVFRLHSNGAVDGSFVQTNLFVGWHVYAIHTLPNGSILIGGGFTNVNGFPANGLALLSSNGVLDTNFHSGFSAGSTVFAITPKPDGKLLIGGLLRFSNGNTDAAIGCLTSSLEWDQSFSPDSFAPTASYPGARGYVRSINLQPDGKIIAGGDFSEVGGYWRYCLARLDEEGRVDPCFDPGLGLVGVFGVLDTALQADGKVLVAGAFSAVNGKQQANIARALPMGLCGATIVHLNDTSPGRFSIAATCAPGGVNILEWSTNLVDWSYLAASATPYVAPYPPADHLYDSAPAVFFRVTKVLFESSR